MANQSEPHRADECSFEVYDALSCRGEQLVWLIPEEDLAQLDSSPPCTARPMLQTGTQPVAAAPAERMTPNFDRPILSFPPGPFSSLLAGKLLAPAGSTRGLLRIAAVVAILLLGSALPSILERVHPAQVKASPTVMSQTNTANTGRICVLTVMAGGDETIEDLSVRFAGHFDNELFQEIRRLNPDVQDPDHLEDGQLIRIPLRVGRSIN